MPFAKSIDSFTAARLSSQYDADPDMARPAALGDAGLPTVSALAALGLITGDAGDNSLIGTSGRDIMIGKAGEDVFQPGAGKDVMIGGRDGDLYVISSSDTEGDTIVEMGSAPNINGYYSSNIDEIQLTGYATLSDAMHAIDLQISGADLVLTYLDPQNPLATGSVTVRNHFTGNRFGIEAVSFDIGGTATLFHVSSLSGDDYTYSVHSDADQGGEDIVLGTDADDEIYGGIGQDILLGGLGADHFMFHDEAENNGSADLILDFDISQDKLDYTDIATMDFSAVSITDSAYGNALVITAYGTIELIGVGSTSVSESVFAFA